MSKPVRVLFVNSWSSCHGGSSTSLLDIVGRLDRSRYEPLVLCPEEGPLPDRLREAKIPVVIHSLSKMTRGQLLKFGWEVPWYSRFLRREKIALIHGNTGCWRRSIVMAARMRGIPYLQHVRNPVNDFATDFAFKYAARIITNSHQVGESLRADENYAAKTTTIYNAVDLAQYSDTDNRRDEFTSEQGPFIGTVGQLVPRKGITTAIEAMRAIVERYPNAVLMIVGCSPPGDDEYEQICLAKTKELGLEANVKFMGYRRDIPALMRTMDLFVLCTRSEPFGKVIVEAMAASCPTVATAVGGIPEIISDDSLGTLIEPDNAEATTNALLAYLDDSELAKRVGNASREHAWNKFGLDAMVRQIESLYDEVLAE